MVGHIDSNPLIETSTRTSACVLSVESAVADLCTDWGEASSQSFILAWHNVYDRYQEEHEYTLLMSHTEALCCVTDTADR